MATKAAPRRRAARAVVAVLAAAAGTAAMLMAAGRDDTPAWLPPPTAQKVVVERTAAPSAMADPEPVPQTRPVLARGSRLPSLPRAAAHSNATACYELCGRERCGNADGPLQPPPVACPGRHLRFPDYFTIGYSQAGSTFFADLLAAHPGVAHACRKEVHFFDRGFFNRNVAIEHYLACFGSHAAPHQLVGDNTVKSIYADEGIALWLRALNPNIKLIVLLRDPIARLQSRYALKGAGANCARHHPASACSGHINEYVERQLEWIASSCPGLSNQTAPPRMVYHCGTAGSHAGLDTDSVVSSLYGSHLDHWISIFPRDQFLFISSERLFRDPAAVMAETAAFLGLAPFDFARAAARRNSHLSRAATRLSARNLSALRRFYEASNRRTAAITGIQVAAE